MMLFSLFLGRRKVGIGHTIIVPMDIMSVLVAVSNASGTMKQTIIVMQEIGLSAQRGAGLVPPVEVVQRCRQELLEILLVLLLATQEQVDQQGPQL